MYLLERSVRITHCQELTMKHLVYLLIIISLNVQADNAYKCIQANGKITFSDRPCPVDSTAEHLDIKKTTWQERVKMKYGRRYRKLEITEDNEDTIIKLNVYSTRDLNNAISQIHILSGQDVSLLKYKRPRVSYDGIAMLRVTNKDSPLSSGKVRTNDSPLFERKDAEIRKLLRAEKDKLLAVYNKEIQQKPELNGEVRFYFGISPEGIVFDAVVNSTTKDPSFESKLLNVIENIDFGPQQVTTKYIEWSIKFESNENS